MQTRNQYASPLWGNAILAGLLSDFLSNFFTKLGKGRVSQVHSLMPNFTVVALKTCGITGVKMAKIAIFFIIFSKKGYTPLTNFYNIWHGGGSSRFAPSRQILPFWLSKCGLTAQKIANNGNFWYGNFWYKFSPKGYIL